jgi:alpha-methylacyl-CoA racemase
MPRISNIWRIDVERCLEGVKILDFTRLLPGPFGTQILGDLGAEVLKIEDLGAGDYARTLPPAGGRIGSFFAALNRNKRSARIDLKTDAGKAVVFRLVSECGYDVVVEGFRPGVAERLGIDYETLKVIRSNVITASLPGFGSGTDRQHFAVHDMNALALAGVQTVCGNEKTGPAVMGVQYDDLTSGMYLAIGVLGAVCHRLLTGNGQRVEVAMADAALALNSTNLVAAAVTGKSPDFADHILSGMLISYNVYRTKDGRYLSIGAVEPKFWVATCQTLGLPELVEEQFADAKEGLPEFEKIKARVAEKTLAQWREAFEEVDACVEPALEALETLEHPYFKQRGIFWEIDDEGEKMLLVGSPVVMSETPPRVFEPVPHPGQHTRKVLQEAGFGDDEIDGLKKEGVVA